MQKTIKLVKNYSDTFNDYENKYDISKADFKKILYAFNTLLAASTVTEGKVYKMPYTLGFLGVFKKPLVGKGIFDYQLWKETGIKRFKKNPHSANLVAQVL